MNLFVDLDTLQLRASGTDSRQVVSIDAKRGDALPLTIRFYQGGSQVRLDATTTINFAIKEDGKYDDDPLVLESSFTASAVGSPDSDPRYTATPSLNTSGLNALFNIDGDSSNDPASVRTMGELSWQATGDTGPTSIKTFTVRMANDVYRGDETTPTVLETPSEWLTARNTERGIQPIRTGTTHLFPDSIIVSGLEEEGLPSSITLPIDEVADGYPAYADTISGVSFTLFYDVPSGPWTLETTSDDFFGGSEIVSDPRGVVLTNGSYDVTIQSSDTSQSPKFGDRGLITGGALLLEKIVHWDGDFWVEPIESQLKTVSDLPSASLNRGRRSMVIDSTVAASGNFGATVVGSGSNTVPVFCDGSNWVIG